MENFVKLNAVYYDNEQQLKSHEVTVNVDTIMKVDPSLVGKNWGYQAVVTLADKTTLYVKESYKKIVGLIGTRTNAVKGMITVTVVKIKRRPNDPQKFTIRVSDIVGLKEDEYGTIIVLEHGSLTCKESYGKVLKMIREAQRA